MLLPRQIDYYGQYTLGIIMIVSLPFFLWFGFLAGLLLIGCWQLFSASVNTPAFLLYGLQQEIGKYWKCTGLVTGMIFLCVPLAELFNPDDVQVIAWIGVIAAIPIAIYYLHIYRKLIDHIIVRREVSGLIKSKHSS